MDDASTAANGSDLPLATGVFFVALKNCNTIKNMPNTDIAFQLANFMDIVIIISNHIQQQDLAAASAPRLTWQGASEKQKSLSPKEILYKSLLKLKKKVDTTIRSSLNNAGSDTRNFLVTGSSLRL